MKFRFQYLVFALFPALISIAFAGDAGFHPVLSAGTLARNGLLVAGNEGLGAIAINPAAMTVDRSWSIELFSLNRYAQQKYYHDNYGLYRSLRENDYRIFGGVAARISSRLSMAFAFYPSLAYRVDWPFAFWRERGTQISIFAFDMFHHIDIDTYAPVLVYKGKTLAVGVTAMINQVHQKLNFPVINSAWEEGKGEIGYPFDLNHTEWGSAFRVGLMAQLNEKTRVGLSLQTPYSVDFNSTAHTAIFAELDSTAATEMEYSTTFEMPWQFAAGLQLTLNKQWTMNIDAAFSMWGSLTEREKIDFYSAEWNAFLTQTDTVTGLQPNSLFQERRNSFDLGLGLEYIASPELSYQFGYRLSTSPNTATTYHLVTPTVSMHWFSAGLSYSWTNLRMAAAIAYALGQKEKIEEEQLIFSQGQYNSYTLIPNISIQYRF
jgi:long-subunit fatty acid transport protein